MSQPLEQVFTFKSGALQLFVEENKEAFRQLIEVENHLKKRFVGMDDAIEALILSVLSGDPLLLIGPPGTAKSQLISAFYSCVEDPVKQNTEGDYFRYLLTRFTEPNELFGYFEIEQPSGRLYRNPANVHTIQHAQVVFLDEVFNASSAILNSLLTFMNERLFFDRGDEQPVNMQCLFGATNDVPHSNDLRAVFDRFLLRWEVHNIDLQVHKAPDALTELLKVGWEQTYGQYDKRDKRDLGILETTKPNGVNYPDLLRNARDVQLTLKDWTIRGTLTPTENQPFIANLARVIQNCRQYGYSEMSNRRVIKMLHVMFLDSVYQGIKNKGDYQMGIRQLGLMRFAVDRWDDGLDNIIQWN
jgi:MoxR-like ATPase